MYIDIFIGVLLVWAIFSGWRNGFVKELFSTIGIIAGLLLAAVVYLYFGDTVFAVNGSEANMVLSIGAFLLIWIALPLVFGLIATVITGAIKGLQLGIPNSLLGMLFSLAKFVLIISCALNMMLQLDILDKAKIKDSVLFEPAVHLLPFIDKETGITDSVKEGLDQITLPDTVWIEMDKDIIQNKDK